jgi:cell division protein FtsI/penicillin-binding protein 2
LCLLILTGRLFYIHVICHDFYAEIARKQHDLAVDLQPKRGVIYDCNDRELAVTLSLASLYACPATTGKPREVARKIAPILGEDEESVFRKLDNDGTFVYLARNLSPDVCSKIQSLRINSIGFIRESKRLYPNAHHLSHVIGFAGIDGKGLEGLEYYYDRSLRGTRGSKMSKRDAFQREIVSFSHKFLPPVDGYDLITSIDMVIQNIVETEIDEIMRVHNPQAAAIIVADPRTGEIRALANRPTFDLNSFSAYTQKEMRNRAITDSFEPGSTFKIVTAVAALEGNNVKEDSRFYCENGMYRFEGYSLHDHKPHGWLSFPEVVEQSSNIGVAKIAQIVGKETLYTWIRTFGFGSRTGVDLPGEASGLVRKPADWSRVSMLTVPMGQEVSATPLQMVMAMSAIANDGVLMKPQVARCIKDKYGEIIKSFPPTEVRRVATPQTVNRLTRILEGVVERGTGYAARLDGFKVAGKTGTGQKAQPGAGYSKDKFIASFIGFAPSDSPVVTIGIFVDEPSDSHFGSVVAAPHFAAVMSKVLNYLGVEPEPETQRQVTRANDDRDNQHGQYD